MAPAVAETRFSLRQDADRGPGFAEAVRSGLSGVKKSIPPRFFYDDVGSSLFLAICGLPEYYLGRAETEILADNRAAIAEALGAPLRVVELGSGASRKTRLLLDELAARPLEYIPIDIDAHLLQETGRDLVAEYPNLTVHAASCDFRRPARIIHEMVADRGRAAVLFLGSTIGNLDRREAVTTLKEVRSVLCAGDTLLLGADLRKPKEVLEAAYNDPLGVTASFNLNVLLRINRELGGHFDLRRFAHRAFYDEELGRIEMHLISLRDQSVLIEALSMGVDFHEGESIHTENSWKYDEETIRSMAAESGFDLARQWSDSRGLFGEFLLVAG